MPYIPEEERAKFEASIKIMLGAIESSGDLNYVITSLLHGRLKELGVSYDNCQNLIGTLESAKMEFYRRVMVDYENKKIEENGDVVYWR